jgi:hypothetical protein
MNSDEILKLINFRDELNPEIWQDGNMRLDVQVALLHIARAFVDFIDVEDLRLTDITISGSNCSFNYNDQSDIDLHLIADMSGPCSVDLKDLYLAKKSLFNDQHDILIRGNTVEVYVQDNKQPHISNGIYSVLRGEWIKEPDRITEKPDLTNIEDKYQVLTKQIQLAIKSKDHTEIEKLKVQIKRMREAGLERSGEFGAENMAFKLLRNSGILERLWEAGTTALDKELSLDK